MMQRIASTGLIIIFLMSLVFHVLVMIGVIPCTIVWGGRVGSKEEMYVMESVSLAINLFFLLVILVWIGKIQVNAHPLVFTLLLWIMALLFLLNTVGNLLSTNEFEKMVFTPVTLICSFFCFVLIPGNSNRV
jgi:hypothetical protein